MAIDFRRWASLPPSQTIVKGQGVDIVERYKYLGAFIDEKLNIDLNTAISCNLQESPAKTVFRTEA